MYVNVCVNFIINKYECGCINKCLHAYINECVRASTNSL